MARNTGETIRVFVPVTDQNFKYGFRVNKKKFNSFGKTLGQKVVEGETGVFYGADSPKPGRAKIKDKNGSRSSFFDQKKAKALQKAGWELSAPSSIRGIKNTGDAITVAVATPYGYSYAWNITKDVLKHFTNFGVLRPNDAENLVWGSFPKPPRARKKINNVTVSTFIKPDQDEMDLAAEKGFTVEGLDPDWQL